MQEIYPYFIRFHIVFSTLFLMLAIYISVHSLVGWVKVFDYGNFAIKLKRTFLISLYIDLVLGIILYFFLQKPEDLLTPAEAMKYSTLRFWAIQHFSNMLFVVIISQVGSIFIKNSRKPVKKFKYSFIYFGISTLITLVSVGLFALRK